MIKKEFTNDLYEDMIFEAPMPAENTCTYPLGEKSVYEFCGDITKLSPADFGMMVRKWRKENGFSQNDVVSRIGVTTAWISDLENGMKYRPYINNFIPLCRMMGFTVKDMRTLMYMYGINNVTGYADMDANLAVLVLRSCDCEEETVRRFEKEFRRKEALIRYKRRESEDGSYIWTEA